MSKKATYLKPLKAGDIVDHPIFGRCQIFEISYMLGFADINLIGQKVEFHGNMRNTYIVKIKDLTKVEN